LISVSTGTPPSTWPRGCSTLITRMFPYPPRAFGLYLAMICCCPCVPMLTFSVHRREFMCLATSALNQFLWAHAAAYPHPAPTLLGPSRPRSADGFLHGIASLVRHVAACPGAPLPQFPFSPAPQLAVCHPQNHSRLSSNFSAIFGKSCISTLFTNSRGRVLHFPSTPRLSFPPPGPFSKQTRRSFSRRLYLLGSAFAVLLFPPVNARPGQDASHGRASLWNFSCNPPLPDVHSPLSVFPHCPCSRLPLFWFPMLSGSIFLPAGTLSPFSRSNHSPQFWKVPHLMGRRIPSTPLVTCNLTDVWLFSQNFCPNNPDRAFPHSFKTLHFSMSLRNRLLPVSGPACFLHQSPGLPGVSALWLPAEQPTHKYALPSFVPNMCRHLIGHCTCAPIGCP